MTEKRFNGDKIYMCMYMCVYIYIHMCVFIYICIHVYIYIRLAINGFKYKPSLLLNIFLFPIPWTFSSILSQVSICFLLNFLSCPIYLKKNNYCHSKSTVYLSFNSLLFFLSLFLLPFLPLFCGQYWE